MIENLLHAKIVLSKKDVTKWQSLVNAGADRLPLAPFGVVTLLGCRRNRITFLIRIDNRYESLISEEVIGRVFGNNYVRLNSNNLVTPMPDMILAEEEIEGLIRSPELLTLGKARLLAKASLKTWLQRTGEKLGNLP